MRTSVKVRVVHLFSALCLLLAAATSAASGAEGDSAVINLALASVACAAVQEVNPGALDDTSDHDYFSHSVTLYQLFHGYSEETAAKHQRSMYNILTAEPAIKAQSLRSVVGAQSYLQQYLRKTDASTCQEIPATAQKILAVYGRTLR